MKLDLISKGKALSLLQARGLCMNDLRIQIPRRPSWHSLCVCMRSAQCTAVRCMQMNMPPPQAVIVFTNCYCSLPLALHSHVGFIGLARCTWFAPTLRRSNRGSCIMLFTNKINILQTHDISYNYGILQRVVERLSQCDLNTSHPRQCSASYYPLSNN
jgi:hypothetical protein